MKCYIYQGEKDRELSSVVVLLLFHWLSQIYCASGSGSQRFNYEQ